ncbi:serine protease, partial [Modicella reniformis]
YDHNPNGGDGVTAFVLDTGVSISHKEFEGRATWGSNIIAGTPDIDENGHGTHCAGTITGKTYGVSKKANIVAIKVLNAGGAGTMSDVIAGIDYAVKQHQSLKEKLGDKHKGSVAN